MSALPASGITTDTPKKIMFGAGTIHKGLHYTAGSGGAEGSWNFAESQAGATSGGSSFTIQPEIVTVEVDGALVKIKQLDVKQGETAEMKVNFVETTPDILKAAVVGQDGNSDVSGFTLIESKSSIAAGDYWDNIAFVGKTLEGQPVIVIMDNALCTSGLDLSGANKEGTVGEYTFECYQALDGDHTILPYHIYYPTISTSNVSG